MDDGMIESVPSFLPEELLRHRRALTSLCRPPAVEGVLYREYPSRLTIDIELNGRIILRQES